ncbi:MAG: alpha/beta hydrolase [Patescibacteria group bacterium]
MNRKDFSVNFNKTKLMGDIMFQDNSPCLLFLHGGSSVGKKRFDKLRESLFNKKISSCAFDFIGHGETAGDVTSSSLESRVSQVLAIVKSQELIQPFSVVASSMSGYIAIKLLGFLNIKNIILLAPAVYASRAYSVCFGSKFSEIIREQYSWRNSDAWEIIENYTGSLLIFSAGKDRVIPNEVIERIYNSATNACSREVITFKDATHPLAGWLDEHPDYLEQVSNKIYNAIAK